MTDADDERRTGAAAHPKGGADARASEVSKPRQGGGRGQGEDPALRAAIGLSVAQARREARMSQVALATALGKPKGWIAKIETGRRSLLFSEAIAVAGLLGIALEQLVPSGSGSVT